MTIDTLPRTQWLVRPPTMSERRRQMASAPRLRIFNFIVAYKSAHDGNSPTSREIMDGANISSTSVVHYHLRKLEVQGKIWIDGNKARRIEVIGGKWTYEEPKAHAAN